MTQFLFCGELSLSDVYNYVNINLILEIQRNVCLIGDVLKRTASDQDIKQCYVLPKTAQYTWFDVSILNSHRVHAFDQGIILAVSFSGVLFMFGRNLRIPVRAPR